MFRFLRRKRAPMVGAAGPEWFRPTDDAGAIRIADLRRVDVQAGDRFVLTMASRISQEHYAALQATWARFMPGASLLILEPGARLGVIRGPAPAEDASHAPSVMTGAPAALDAAAEAALAAETRGAPLDE